MGIGFLEENAQFGAPLPSVVKKSNWFSIYAAVARLSLFLCVKNTHEYYDGRPYNEKVSQIARV